MLPTTLQVTYRFRFGLHRSGPRRSGRPCRYHAAGLAPPRPEPVWYIAVVGRMRHRRTPAPPHNQHASMNRVNQN